jgi:hypothetical protein
MHFRHFNWLQAFPSALQRQLITSSSIGGTTGCEDALGITPALSVKFQPKFLMLYVLSGGPRFERNGGI